VPSEDTQRLRDEIVRWRAELEETCIEPERRALKVAIKALELCLDREVVPRLEGSDDLVRLVIPPRGYAIRVVETAQHSHGPVVAECELFGSPHAALALVDEAHRASEHVPGWAPLFIERWVSLLRRECERALQPPVTKLGPRLVVAPEGDEPS